MNTKPIYLSPETRTITLNPEAYLVQASNGSLENMRVVPDEDW